jgi:hypothetical protein
MFFEDILWIDGLMLWITQKEKLVWLPIFIVVG